MRRAIDWAERQVGRADELMKEVSPIYGQADAGEQILSRTMLGIPTNIGQAMKPSKYLYEAAGGAPPKKKRKMSANGKKRAKLMSKNLKICNKRGRLKNGEYRKGWGQSRIMTCAHKMTRRDMKK